MKAKAIPTAADFRKQAKEIEEENKKKKDMQAANYFLAAQDYKRKEELSAETFKSVTNSIGDAFSSLNTEQKKKLPIVYKDGSDMVERVNIVAAFRQQFFSIKSHPQAEEIKKHMRKLGMESSDFSTVALCATEDNIEKFQKHFANLFKKFKGQKASVDPLNDEELAEIKSSSVEKARIAIESAAEGDPKRLAFLLKNGLENCCRRFADNRISNAKAMEWSENVFAILHIMESNPAIMEAANLTSQQYECAKETAEMGLQIRSGLQAIEILSQVQQQKGRKLEEEKNRDLLNKVLNMHVVTYDRSQFIKMWDEPAIENPSMKK